MKIRQGFVSNSSSCSFLIYGARISIDECTDILISKIPKSQIELDKIESLYAITDISDISFYDALQLYEDMLDEQNKQNTLNFTYLDDEYEVAVGANPTELPDDMTMGEWKQQIKKELQEFGIDDELCFHEGIYPC